MPIFFLKYRISCLKVWLFGLIVIRVKIKVSQFNSSVRRIDVMEDHISFSYTLTQRSTKS